MKRNLLMLLFAMLIGAFTSAAQDLNFTIDIDNPANAKVAIGYSPYDDPVTLQAGVNNVSGPNGGAVFVTPQSGAELTVTLDGMALSLGGGGFYNARISEGMTLKIVSAGNDGPKKIKTSFYLNNPGTATLTTGGETVDIDFYSYDVVAGEYAVITPKEGYAISKIEPYFITDYQQNSDGTVSFMPEDYGMMNIYTKLKGIDFSVDINVAANVIINAFDEENTELGIVALEGNGAPYTATAPLTTQTVTFAAPEGGEIKAVKRVAADGTETVISVSGNSEGGWRSKLEEGDTFVIDATGPEAEIAFVAYTTAGWSRLDLSNFIVKAGEEILKLEGENPVANVRVGEIVTVTAGRGYQLMATNGVSGYSCCTSIDNEGSVQSVMITAGGTLQLYADPMTDMAINVDNAAAVKVQAQNGNGAVLELTDGTNRLTEVANPLRITANEGYEILSVTVDGEAVEAINGYYLVELLEGMTLDITSRKLPEAFPVTIMTVNGDVDNLIIRQEGEIVDYSNGLKVTTGSFITIEPKLGYIIESLSDFNGNTYEEDADTHVWTVWFTQTASMISVTFKEAAEGKAFVGFDRDATYVTALVYTAAGERNPDTPSLKAGQTVEVNIGDQIELYTWGNHVDFNTVTVNGTAIEIPEGTTTLDRITIEGRTVIDVTTVPHEEFVSVTGDEAIETTLGTGAVIGTIYINEIGNRRAELKQGSTFYAIPAPTKGYKFDSFIIDYRNEAGVSSSDLSYTGPVDGKYEFTIPEDASFIFLKGVFVIDNENPAYMVEGNNVYEGSDDLLEERLCGIVRIDNGTQTGTLNVFAYEGEEVDLLFFQNIDDFPIEEYYCYSFCLMNNPEVLIPSHYVVNPNDVRDNNIISIGAIFKKREESGLAAVTAGNGTLAYDHATFTVVSDTDVRVFTTSGKLVKEIPAGEGSIESLAPGIYIIANATEVVKIVR